MAPKRSATKKMLTMKLLVNSKTKRVLYAEAGKDVVDFLFSLLTLPVGTVVKLLSTDTMVGSVGNLYASMENLDDTYVSHDNAKKALLTPAGSCGSDKLLQLPEPETESSVLYRCNNGSTSCRSYVSKVCGMRCPNCGNSIVTQLQPLVEPEAGSSVLYLYRCNNGSSSCRNYATKVSGLLCPGCRSCNMTTLLQPLVEPDGGSGGHKVPRAAGVGFVQGIVTYTVMDDLKVSPMSSISGITLLNSFGVTDIGSLQEKTVLLGYAEGLEILKASLQSKTVLTDVFLGKKRVA